LKLIQGGFGVFLLKSVVINFAQVTNYLFRISKRIYGSLFEARQKIILSIALDMII